MQRSLEVRSNGYVHTQAPLFAGRAFAGGTRELMFTGEGEKMTVLSVNFIRVHARPGILFPHPAFHGAHSG